MSYLSYDKVVMGSMNNRSVKAHIVLTVFVMVFIFIHSAMPGDVSGAESDVLVRLIASVTGLDPGPMGLIVRKAAHFTEFMALGICLSLNARDWADQRDRKYPDIGLLAIIWALGTAYAVTDEIHQLFVPGRACALADVFIDSAGVLAGIVLLAAAVKARVFLYTEKSGDSHDQ